MESPGPQPTKPPAAARSSRSQRKLTFGRRLVYKLAVWIAQLYIELLWKTCRLQVLNEPAFKKAIADFGAIVPVCWHQHLLMCARYIVDTGRHGLKPGFMISPSVDGEAPTWLAQHYGAQVVRGSGSYTGVRALRGVYQAIVKEKISPLITPDGPRGPRFRFKPGAIFTAQISAAPLVPLAFAARPAKVLGTWDKFVLPAPFGRLVICAGEPVHVPRELSEQQRDQLEVEMQHRMHECYQQAAAVLCAT